MTLLRNFGVGDLLVSIKRHVEELACEVCFGTSFRGENQMTKANRRRRSIPCRIAR